MGNGKISAPIILSLNGKNRAAYAGNAGKNENKLKPVHKSAEIKERVR
jgi:hypothetical protein